MYDGPAARLGALLLVLAAAACTRDQVVGRYRTATCETDVLPLPVHVPPLVAPQGSLPEAAPAAPCASVIPRASASVVSIPTPQAPAAATTGTSLPERAQARYIAELAKYGKSAADLRANLGANIVAADASSGAENRSVLHRTLVVSVRKAGGFNPVDRLEATDVSIRPIGARFDSWDTLATTYTTINAGTVQLTQARGLTENLTAGAPSTAPVSGSLSLGGSQTDTRVENLSALSTPESLSATIEDGVLRIRRQGGYGIDLTGNTVVKVDLAYAIPEHVYLFSAKGYTDQKGHWLPPAKVSFMLKPAAIVPPGTSIEADVFLTYTIRHVIHGGKTYEEKDDTVLERTVGPVYTHAVLVPGTQVPPLFGIFLTAGSHRGFNVEITEPGMDPVPLCFDTYNEARDFLAYLRAGDVNPDHIGNADFGIFDPPRRVPLTHPDAQQAQVQPTCA